MTVLFSSDIVDSSFPGQPLTRFSYSDNARKYQSCQGSGFPRTSTTGSSVSEKTLLLGSLSLHSVTRGRAAGQPSSSRVLGANSKPPFARCHCVHFAAV